MSLIDPGWGRQSVVEIENLTGQRWTPMPLKSVVRIQLMQQIANIPDRFPEMSKGQVAKLKAVMRKHLTEIAETRERYHDARDVAEQDWYRAQLRGMAMRKRWRARGWSEENVTRGWIRIRRVTDLLGDQCREDRRALGRAEDIAVAQIEEALAAEWHALLDSFGFDRNEAAASELESEAA